MEGSGDTLKSAWLVSFVRIPLLVVMMGIQLLVLSLLSIEVHFPFLPDLSAIYFTFVNIFCFYLLYRIVKKEGRTLKQLVGFQRNRLGKDILFGFLWLIVLYIPFVMAVIGTMFFMYGPDFYNYFESVFVGEASTLTRPVWLTTFGAFVALLFPFLNAPIEELMYRGYAQSKFFENYQKAWLAIIVPSVGFALQHIMLAPTIQGAVVYCVAFFCWGIGSGIIYHIQKRLFPLLVCHFIVNLAFSIFPIVFIFLGVY